MNTTYIHEIDSLCASDGELYIGSGDTQIVINTDSLYKDLHIIIDMVIKENDNEQALHKDMLNTCLRQHLTTNNS